MNSSIHSTQITVVGNYWFPKNPGGLDRYVYELVHNLIKLQTNVELFGIGLPTSRSKFPLQLTNLAESEASLLKRLWSANQVFNSGFQSQPDAINLHFALYGLPLLPHLPKDVPVTCTFHGPWAQESDREGSNKLSILFKKLIEQTVYQRCDRFIVLSKAFGEILHREYHISWEQIHVIPGGVDIQHFQPNLTRQQAREKLEWSPDRFILFTPRRLVHRMGLDKLLLAVAQVKQTYPDIWLAIAGRGPLRDDLEHQTKELELQNHVQFLGFLPDEDLPIAYQAADLTIMPSQSLEGFGLVLVESLACGTPVVCTPVGGMPEVIGDFSPHLITQTSGANSIAHALTDILSGQITLPTRTACSDYAKQRFDWTAIAQQVRQFLLA
ncbi:MAG: group 1 glycosyl transferase [Leptolyngbya sp.]|nr:MAG: group 1 glycosyl transferase [Leptolyngbya sp.]